MEYVLITKLFSTGTQSIRNNNPPCKNKMQRNRGGVGGYLRCRPIEAAFAGREENVTERETAQFVAGRGWDGDGAMRKARNGTHRRVRRRGRGHPASPSKLTEPSRSSKEKKALVLPGRVMARRSGTRPTFAHGPSPFP